MPDLYHSIEFVLLHHAGEKSPVALLQYLLKNEHKVRCLNPQGNNKWKVP